ncbi:CBS domain-containing protein CBSX1, chloroplastic-like [Gossypium arboreum]|uniref:CBS domain-containing protein CBSX1, chloroplastic-like n=1 Tax=Gossypium arboreum TaxID=29729 RepID=UPI0008197238|nr:CBS domain-containing protein CBSX1, chloroplastic-like [Gossypium arboreum]
MMKARWRAGKEPVQGCSIFSLYYSYSTPRGAVYTVGDFMTGKEDLHVVKPTTTVDEALEALVEHRIIGFPVINDDWKLVCYLSLNFFLFMSSTIGSGRTHIFVYHIIFHLLQLKQSSILQTFNEVQKLLNKTNGLVVGDLMTPAPLVVRETTNLKDAARNFKLLLETKYRRLPVVDVEGKLVGIITRGNIIRAALQIKREIKRKA